MYLSRNLDKLAKFIYCLINYFDPSMVACCFVLSLAIHGERLMTHGD